MKEALKVASAVVGLLAGVIAGIYVLGGVVIALRLLFDHFSFSSITTILGQLPQEPVVATALMEVLAPAVLAGLLMAMLYGLFNRPKPRETEPGSLNEGYRWQTLTFVLAPIGAILICLPLVIEAVSEKTLLVILASLIGVALTYCGLLIGVYLIQVVGHKVRPRASRALLAGALWSAMAIIPFTIIVSEHISFDHAQVCTTDSQVPLKGRLIGEGGDRVLIEEQFGNESAVISLPADEVTRTEYGDLVTNFACPLPPGTKVSAKVAEAKLDGHGSRLERRLATLLRPRLRFDTAERWRPLEVKAFLAERFDDGGHEACRGAPQPLCRPIEGLSELRRGREAPDFVEIYGNAPNGDDYEAPPGTCEREPRVLDCVDGANGAIYYRRTTHEGRWYWDYWWFFRYNDYNGRFSDCRYYCADHEGDWEGITVITTPSLQPEILGVIYAAHKDRVLVNGEVVPRSGTHPLAFVANGSHATYPFRCHGGDCKQYSTISGVRLPEGDHDGEKTWSGNNDAICTQYRCVRPLPEVGSPPDAALPLGGRWAGWSGKWGSSCVVRKCKRAESSPASPGSQIRFRCPWASTRWGVLSPDGTVSRSERAGDAERLRATCEAQRGD